MNGGSQSGGDLPLTAGAAFRIYSGTYTMTGGTVSGSSSAVSVYGGSFVQNGGSVTNTDVQVGVNSGASNYNLMSGPLTVTNAKVGVGGTCTLTQSGGSASATSLYVGLSSTGTYNLTAGTLEVGSGFFPLDANSSVQGNFNQSGGAATISTSATFHLGENSGSTGNYTLSSTGSLSSGALVVGATGTGNFTHNGGTFTTNNKLLTLGSVSGAQGTYRPNGGTVTVQSIARGSGTGTFYFNGGTLLPAGASTTFMTGLTTANVQTGGAIVDTNGFNVTIGQPLVHDTTAGAPALDGGLDKKGLGTLTQSNTNTYTGLTLVEKGTLAITGSISASSSFSIRSGATLNTPASGLSLGNGQWLAGAGTVTGAVVMGAGAKLAPGDETTGTLTANGNLDLSVAVTAPGGAALLYELGDSANSDKVAFTAGVLTLGNDVLGFDDFAFTVLSGFTNGTHCLT